MDLSRRPAPRPASATWPARTSSTTAPALRLDTPQKILTCGDPKNDGTGGPTLPVRQRTGADRADRRRPDRPPRRPPRRSRPPRARRRRTTPRARSSWSTPAQHQRQPVLHRVRRRIDAVERVPEVGTVTKGLDLVEKRGRPPGPPAPTASPRANGKPTKALTIQSVAFARRARGPRRTRPAAGHRYDAGHDPDRQAVLT